MTKIQRTMQKVFAGEAGSQQITEFGTPKTDNPVYTQDLTQIQNTNYMYGWGAALLPDKSPWQEDMNALFYLVTKQLAYLFQEGIPEYDPGTEYSKNSFARGVGSKIIYCSLQDNNTGNPLDNPDYWEEYFGGGGKATYEIGLPQPTFSNTLFDNEVWLEGQEVSRSEYKNLFNIYGTTYGAGNGSTTFNLPDCRNRVFWGATSFGYLEAELPNIKGEFGCDDRMLNRLTGPFYRGAGSYPTASSGTENSPPIAFDASLVSPAYKNNGTVRPPAIKIRVKTRYY